MSNNTEMMKRLIDQCLLDPQPQSSPNTYMQSWFSRLIQSCESKGIFFDSKAAVEYWWALARLGVIAIPGVELNSTNPEIPRLILTERGRKLLEQGEQSPHDPPRYLDAVRRRVESPDEIVMTYLNEAVGTWSAGFYRASAVMLGCACEQLVLLLAKEISRVNVQPWSDRINRKLKAEPVSISSVFNVVRECLIQLSGEKKLPDALSDAIDRKLTPIFDYARRLRNKSGHPTGDDVPANDAEAGLLLFPGFYAFVDDLCKHLKASSK
jgi:hypothetical protein